MKKIKLIALSALAFVTIASTIFVSCNKSKTSQTNPIETPKNINSRLTIGAEDKAEFDGYIRKYSKEITVFDISNENYVTLNISSESESALNSYIDNQDFSIDLLYNYEKAPESQEVENTPNEENGNKNNNCITSIVTKTNINSNSIGFRLTMKLKEHTRASSSGTYIEPPFVGMTEHMTLANGIITTFSGSSTLANSGLYIEKWAKKKSLSTWSFKGDGYIGIYPLNSSMNYCIKDQNRIMVQVNYNWPGTYSVSFYGSSSC